MNVGYRDQNDAQLAGRDCDLAGVADVTATRVALSKTTALYAQNDDSEPSARDADAVIGYITAHS